MLQFTQDGFSSFIKVLTTQKNTFKLGVSRALKQRSQQPKAGAVSWPIPVTLKLQ